MRTSSVLKWRVLGYLVPVCLILLFAPVCIWAGGPVHVKAEVHPGTVPPGHPAEIFVEVHNAKGAPVVGAHVEVSAGGGVFLDSKNTVVDGQTDHNGIFVTPWKCDKCAPAYQFDIKVNKPGFGPWSGKALVKIGKGGSPPPPPPPPGPGGAIRVHAHADPPDIPANHPTEIVVEAQAPGGHPLEGAEVHISAGGGLFLDSNKTQVHGKTAPDGVFRTPWKCSPCAGAYQFDIQVNKPGFAAGHAKANVKINTQPGPPAPAGGPLKVIAQADPPKVHKGQPTDVVVRVFAPNGHPLPGAEVKVAAGGGEFPGQKGLTVHGMTGPNGEFRTQWKCTSCAPAYVFDIEVGKHGFDPAKAQATVNIN